MLAARQFSSAGGTLLTCCAPFVNIQFLGSSLTFMMVSDSLPCLLHLPRSLLSLATNNRLSITELSCEVLMMYALSGVCMGEAASICQLEFLGHLQLHGTVSSVGAVGLQCGAAKLTCCGLTGHAGRYPLCTTLHPFVLYQPTGRLPACCSSCLACQSTHLMPQIQLCHELQVLCV